MLVWLWSANNFIKIDPNHVNKGVRLGWYEESDGDRGSGFLMTYTFKRKLMFNNKSPRRIDRRSGARNKKIILKSYQKIIKGKKK